MNLRISFVLLVLLSGCSGVQMTHNPQLEKFNWSSGYTVYVPAYKPIEAPEPVSEIAKIELDRQGSVELR